MKHVRTTQEIKEIFVKHLDSYNPKCLSYWFDWDTGNLKSTQQEGLYTQDDEFGNGCAAADSTDCPICKGDKA